MSCDTIIHTLNMWRREYPEGVGSEVEKEEGITRGQSGEWWELIKKGLRQEVVFVKKSGEMSAFVPL